MIAELKLKTLMPREIADAVGGTLKVFGAGEGRAVTNITYDSRDVKCGSLFCAIKGERSDGHNFIKDCVEKGCAVVLADHLPEGARSFGDYCAVIVKDTVASLGRLAGYYRQFSDAVAVGVTGSVGKTTTKDFVASVAGAAFNTLKTEGNHNNEIGLPMTLFSLAPECRVAVLEMGMSSLGEISFMSKLAKPKIGVITNIGTSHLEKLGNRENICRAKLEMADGMSEDGVLFMNADEPLLTEQKDKLAVRCEYFGIFNRNADYKAINIRTLPDGMTFDVLHDSKAYVNVDIPILGRHNVYNALTAFAVGTALGMNEDDIRRGLMRFVGTEMRQKIYDVGKITVIEDCYNASPESMRAALEVLISKASGSGGTPCALLGDMLELGDNTRLLHDQLGQFAAQLGIEKLYCYGSMADTVAEAAIKKGVRADSVYVCTDISKPEIMAKMIADRAEEGDVLLVKASRGIRAENVIAELKELL
ncbi:MAG: UDP-N-acetylmuramoyl-tripeptide--D-alanyl-D-alanine ligase [Clostridia bacterium]|nr:UDP-N-acetylmuramoyl-tripeptide--D-alanyl-D-alanine ligase [Clostridia bacterium]